MRLKITAIIVAIFLLIAAPMIAASASPQVQATRIETDQKTGVIRFIVKGQEEARIDSTGLYVRQGVTYGGALTDVGQKGYDAQIAGKP